MKGEDIEMRIVKGGGTDNVVELDEADTALAKIPPASSVFLHSFLRLMVMPGIMLGILVASIKLGIVPEEQHLIQLIIAVEAAAPSAQMMIVSLNELGIQDMAGSLAFMYIPHYLLSSFTITGWTALAGHIIYGDSK